MEKVKSRAINMMYGISKIHTNVEFTFSNNNCQLLYNKKVYNYKKRCIIVSEHTLFLKEKYYVIK